tara:strand:- start:306 stop:689 length:384 start_codon:yes stop_codon:yes gene_type:complete
MNDWKGFGNIAQAPEHGTTNNGTPYCNFAVGCREIKRKKNYSDKSTFIDCVVYGQAAEYMKRAGQGDEILIAEGSIQVQKWKDQEGKTQRKYRVAVDRFILPKDKDRAMEFSTEFNSEPQEVANPFG